METLSSQEPDLAACYLLEAEVRRAGTRLPGVQQSAITAVLDGVALHETPPSLYREAGLLPGNRLRSLEAIHLAAAVRLGAERVATYDQSMQEAAAAIGLICIAPGGEVRPG